MKNIYQVIQKVSSKNQRGAALSQFMSTEVTFSRGKEKETENMSAETFRFSSSSLLEITNAEPRAGYEPLDLLTLFCVRNLRN